MKKTDEQLQQEVAEIRRFVDGEIAKKVIPIGYNAAIGTAVGECPECKTLPLRECDCAYCPNCGQKLDWSEMRLIDADKLLTHLNDCALSASPGSGSLKELMLARAEYNAIQNCMKAVEEQPTAYDVDAVIERLKGRREAAFHAGNKITLGDVYGLDEAIEIVKAGGSYDK